MCLHTTTSRKTRHLVCSISFQTCRRFFRSITWIVQICIYHRGWVVLHLTITYMCMLRWRNCLIVFEQSILVIILLLVLLLTGKQGYVLRNKTRQLLSPMTVSKLTLMTRQTVGLAIGGTDRDLTDWLRDRWTDRQTDQPLKQMLPSVPWPSIHNPRHQNHHVICFSSKVMTKNVFLHHGRKPNLPLGPWIAFVQIAKDFLTHRLTGRQMGRQPARQTDQHIDRQADR